MLCVLNLLEGLERATSSFLKRPRVIQLCVQPFGFGRQFLGYLGWELGSPERAEPREPNPDTHVLARSRRPRTGTPSSNDYRIGARSSRWPGNAVQLPPNLRSRVHFQHATACPRAAPWPVWR